MKISQFSITSLILLAAGTACSGTDTTEVWTESSLPTFQDHPDIPVPGQEGRIDGSPWLDGLFNNEEAKEEFCAEYGDLEEAWFCSNLGQTEQTFTSEVFHGLIAGVDGTCYGPKTSSSKDCLFPAKKQFRVRIDTSGCFSGEAPPNGPSTLQEQNILNGLKEGVKLWHGKGGLIVVNEGSIGSANYIPVAITCGPTNSPTALAEGGLSGVGTDRGDLPVASNRDPRHAKVVSGAVYVVNMKNTFNFIKSHCGSDGTLQFNTARYIGLHEFGHVIAFSHFGSNSAGNVMNPFTNTCAPSSTIANSFSTALSNFNPASGTPTVTSSSGIGSYSPL